MRDYPTLLPKKRSFIQKPKQKKRRPPCNKKTAKKDHKDMPLYLHKILRMRRVDSLCRKRRQLTCQSTWLNSSLSPSGPEILKYLHPFCQKFKNTGASSKTVNPPAFNAAKASSMSGT